ncbi:MAG: DNA-binding response regulator [Actinobacteria bacterium HGW-Actinobacteria-6]|jgi:DNA-binding response OmpR family regulator|nr:MAG: DNA-binding response regulator [Actinobacteria bacterium HGW-Actinobacteria-6]
MPTALVVDDEANIRELVSVYLTSAGFAVGQAEDGITGLSRARSGEFDIVVLDMMLPGLDGASVCRQLRETSSVPVIMLTARDTELDKIAMLESGADDYLTKPFSPPELVARVRAVLRRAAAGTQRQERLSVGGLTLDPATREATVDGHTIELTAKEFDLLAVMMRDAGVVFSRERLLEAAWGFSDFVDSRGIDVHIKHMREKLGDNALAPRFLETVRGVGYRVRKDAE